LTTVGCSLRTCVRDSCPDPSLPEQGALDYSETPGQGALDYKNDLEQPIAKDCTTGNMHYTVEGPGGAVFNRSEVPKVH
jgi:hypothetical protein